MKRDIAIMKLPRKSKKLVLRLLFILIPILVLFLIVFAVQQWQETRTRAERTTRLYFNPITSAANPYRATVGTPVPFELMVDPGTNVVSFIKFEIIYDPTKFSVSGTNAILINTDAFPELIEETQNTPGRIAGVVSIGNDPTKAVQSPTQVARITFTPTAYMPTPNEILFGLTNEVYSIGSNDQAGENVLSTTESAFLVASAGDDVCEGDDQVTGTPQRGSISGTVFHDEDVDGIFDTTEPTLPNWTIELRSSENVLMNSTTTNASGSYTFATLCNNSYRIRAASQNDWVQTLPLNNQPYTVEISNGNNVTNRNFGFTEPESEDVGVTFNLDLLLHGLGNAGDSPNPQQSTLSNKNPLTQEKSVSIQIINADNELVGQYFGTIRYASASGTFVGSVNRTNLSGNYELTPGPHSLKIKTDRYLRKLLPGSYEVLNVDEYNIPRTEMVAGDINGDNILSVLDYNILYNCGYGKLDPLPMSDPQSVYNSTACQAHATREQADLTDNGTIASNDFNLFIRELSVQVGN